MYQGYLLKIGNYIVPDKYIRADSYSPYVNMQDVGAYTDANGYLHRNAVELKVAKVEFETVAMMTNKTFSEFMKKIQENYLSEKERKVVFTAYIPEYDDYVTQTGYLADFTPKIYGTYGGVIHYNPVRLAFIGGVYND